MNKHYKYLYIALGFLLIFMVMLTYLCFFSDQLRVFDETIFNTIVSLRNPFTVTLALVLSYIGEPLVIVALILVLLVLPNRKRYALPVGITTGVSLIFNEIIKYSARRTRPLWYFLQDIGYKFPTSYSFPSGHSQNDLVFFLLLSYLLIRRFAKNEKLVEPLTFISALIIMLIGLSRPFIGVHYPSDVIGGWSLGFFFFFMYRYIESYRIIGSKVHIIVDRPIGSIHPTHNDITYKVNYGYIKGVMALDNEEQDAYILGVDKKLKEFDGRVIGIIHRDDDVEEKWVVAPFGKSFTNKEIMNNVSFVEQYFKTKLKEW